MGFGLVARFIGHLELASPSNSNSSWIYTVYNSLSHSMSSQTAVSSPVLHSSILVKALCFRPEGRRFETE
jgi:hypothetical protein